MVLDPAPDTTGVHAGPVADSGFITPTLKVKRNQIEDAYGAFFEAWTAQGKAVIWVKAF